MAVIRTPIKMHLTSMVKEHWTADTKEELLQTFESVERSYPTQGYGTMITNIRQDPTGALWHADFNRFNSCD
jgi:hypothetical protein